MEEQEMYLGDLVLSQETMRLLIVIDSAISSAATYNNHLN
jgi:hypothetical protein